MYLFAYVLSLPIELKANVMLFFILLSLQSLLPGKMLNWILVYSKIKQKNLEYISIWEIHYSH